MEYQNQYNLKINESRFLLKKNVVELIHSTSRLENVNTTFPQTKTIVDGMSVAGVDVHDIQVILNLRNAYKYVLGADEGTVFDWSIACKINSYISYNESLEWGVIRRGDVGIHGVNYKPQIPVESEVVSYINRLMHSDLTATHKALKYMYWAMRSQNFWDGNKRTALVSANFIMMMNGAGVINISEQELETWNKLLSDFYETNDDSTIIKWTYDNCIYGIKYN